MKNEKKTDTNKERRKENIYCPLAIENGMSRGIVGSPVSLCSLFSHNSKYTHWTSMSDVFFCDASVDYVCNFDANRRNSKSSVCGAFSKVKVSSSHFIHLLFLSFVVSITHHASKAFTQNNIIAILCAVSEFEFEIFNPLFVSFFHTHSIYFVFFLRSTCDVNSTIPLRVFQEQLFFSFAKFFHFLIMTNSMRNIVCTSMCTVLCSCTSIRSLYR